MVQLLVNCNSASLNTIFIIVKRIMLLIQIFIPIILIVSSSISIIKLVGNPDQKDGVKKVIYKFLAAFIVFFIPLLVNVTMNIIGDNTISSCWKNTSEKIQGSSSFSKINDKPGKSILTNPSDYEKGVPSGNLSKNNNTNIVFIGNSKTQVSDIPGIVNSMASSVGYKVSISSIVEGGKTLDWHASNNSQAIANKYDIAVLQEQTNTMESDLALYTQGAKKVASLLRSKNSKIAIYVRQCWGYKSNVGNSLHQSVQTNALEVAKAIDAKVIKDGSAWDKYNNFDRLYSDDTHQSGDGAYLAAACIFKTISNNNLSKVTYYGGVDESTAKEFLRIANSVC